MADSREGVLTLLFTDIEGSTRLWEQHPEGMRTAVARHDTLLRQAIDTHGGTVFKTGGDAFYAVFAAAPDALAAAVAAQRALQTEAWEDVGTVRVRMALHTGPAEHREGDYFGLTLNRVARFLDAGHGGQILLSRATVDLVQELLPPGASLRDLGGHRLKDLQQPEHLFQLAHPELLVDFPPLRSLEAFAHNLPRQLSSFIGREQEMAEVKQLLPTTPLLTLTGIGGCGKTRLALQVAAGIAAEYADGAWLVEFAALSDASLVPQTVAAALGVREELGRPLTATLANYLRPKSLLLVLDNCEHLLSGCAHLAEELLRSCPNLRILATSREVLGTVGELTYRVPSLTLPELPASGAGRLTAGDLLQSEAVHLFIERATFSQPRFAVTEQNAASVAQVCWRLDGIPLALELAAARVKVLSVEQIAQRLDDRFRLLIGGSRTALPRQQTLRALIDWSYDLLPETERQLLCRLSVFAGGWTLEAAEKVGAGEGIDEDDVLDLLSRLVEKSLVLMEETASGEARYRLLETIRHYGREKLGAGEAAAALRGRHRDWYLALVEQFESASLGPEQQEWLERLETEHDNLRVALEWCRATGENEVALQVSEGLAEFWMRRGYLSEGRERLTGMLMLPQRVSLGSGGPGRTAVRAKALWELGRLAWMQSDFASAHAPLEESLAIARELGLRPLVAWTLSWLAHEAALRGDFGMAREFQDEGLAIFRESGEERGLVFALDCRGHVAAWQGYYEEAAQFLKESLTIARGSRDRQELLPWALVYSGCSSYLRGDYESARSLFEEMLTIGREHGLPLVIAWSLTFLGVATYYAGDDAAARPLLEESIARSREVGIKHSAAYALNALGHMATGQGGSQAALALHVESLAIWREMGGRPGIADSLEGMARALALASHRSNESAAPPRSLRMRSELPQRKLAAARLAGAAAALREAIDARVPVCARGDYDGMVLALRDGLGEDAFSATWAEGQAMTLEQVLDYARETSLARWG
jgi:predicted ATPase/class 3 adenylate cyclase